MGINEVLVETKESSISFTGTRNFIEERVSDYIWELPEGSKITIWIK